MKSKSKTTNVWRDYSSTRVPGRLRGDNHRRKLSEFICHLNGQNYFTPPFRVVTLDEHQVTPEAVELWARVRMLISQRELDPAHGRIPLPPLFLVADALQELQPTLTHYKAARRDLLAAVGARAAVSDSDRMDQLVYS